MFTASPEQNSHRKGDDTPEADPPREFHHRQPARLMIDFRAENARDVVRQSAYNCDNDKAGDHSNEIAAIVSARLCQHAGEKDSEDGAVSVTVNAEDDRDNAHIGPYNHKIRSARCDKDHENRKPDSSPAHRAQAFFAVRTS